ncbi:MAG: hypothetical protein JNL96_14210 [Planctomycetaceae bacterium]|nr:hypothetical protein [Planctomycetaceae bacterium]
MARVDRSFEEAAGEGRSSLFGEFFGFLMDNKKWWLLPILLMFLALGTLVVLGSGGAAPFIYTLF